MRFKYNPLYNMYIGQDGKMYTEDEVVQYKQENYKSGKFPLRREIIESLRK